MTAIKGSYRTLENHAAEENQLAFEDITSSRRVASKERAATRSAKECSLQNIDSIWTQSNHQYSSVEDDLLGSEDLS